MIFVFLLLKDSVLLLKCATPLDPNFIFSVILDKSFKNDMSIKKHFGKQEAGYKSMVTLWGAESKTRKSPGGLFYSDQKQGDVL